MCESRVFIRDEYNLVLCFILGSLVRVAVQSNDMSPDMVNSCYRPPATVSVEFHIFQIDRRNIKHDENHEKLRVREHERHSKSSSDR